MRTVFTRRCGGGFVQRLASAVLVTVTVSAGSVRLVAKEPTVSSATYQRESGRPMTVNDVLARQRFDGIALSPDGNWAAVVVQRPRKAGELYARGYMGGAERCDVWLVPTKGGPPINVTRGEPIHAGYWEPIWSPDSKRLVMSSTNGADNVRAYFYDIEKRRLRRLTNDGIDLGLGIDAERRTIIQSRWFSRKAPTMHWLDPTHVLLGILPAGVRPQPFDELERTSEIANDALAAVKHGRTVTAHVLTSGESEGLKPPSSEVALTVVDTETGSRRVITKIPLTEIRLSQRVVSISPNRDYAAIMATYAPTGIRAARQLPASDTRFQRLGAIEFKEGQTIRWLDVKPLTFGAVGTATPIRWSPSGSLFAALGILGAHGLEAKAFTVNLAGEGIHAPKAVPRDVKPATSDLVLVPEDFQWADDSLLVYGYTASRVDLHSESVARSVRGFGIDNTIDSARRDWWIVSNDGSSRNLTREMAQSPRRLLPMRRPGVMLGNASGELWAVDLGAGQASPLEVTPNIQATAILDPAPEEAPKIPIENLLISSATDAGVDVYQLKLSDSRIDLHRSVKLPKGASYREHLQQGGLVVYETLDTKLFLHRDGSEAPVTLFSLNRHMDSIAKPELRRFEYRSTDGKMLKGALLMPHGYVSGRRYPLVVIVYGGSVPWTGDLASPYGTSPYYPEPLPYAGRGYAVLVPSVPLQPMGVGSDPMLDLDKGVKPAIEKVVEMGVADANRVGVIGHSYGGYTVYGLVTQTNRFRAAVAFSGVSDLVSMHGRLDSRYRFSSTINPLSGPASTESQQLRMGAPPWEDPDRYLRNSPFFHAHRVTTPLLMIHGDLDSISMTQAEQFFIAMNRLNKRSKLVRYLGEGHGIDSPANVRDLWQQIFSWFDEFLMQPQKAEGSKQ